MNAHRASFRLLGLVAPLAGGAAGCGDECTPLDFAGGYQCSAEPGVYLSCRLVDGLFGGYHWSVREDACPTSAPTCVESEPGIVACIGEIVGTCSARGFVACADPFTELFCRDDGYGGLALQRGPCAPGARCRDADAPSGPRGCDPAY